MRLFMDQPTIAWMRPVSVATVQANYHACRSDVNEFKAHTAWIDVDDNSAIDGFLVAQTMMQLQIIEVLR